MVWYVGVYSACAGSAVVAVFLVFAQGGRVASSRVVGPSGSDGDVLANTCCNRAVTAVAFGTDASECPSDGSR